MFMVKPLRVLVLGGFLGYLACFGWARVLVSDDALNLFDSCIASWSKSTTISSWLVSLVNSLWLLMIEGALFNGASGLKWLKQLVGLMCASLTTPGTCLPLYLLLLPQFDLVLSFNQRIRFLDLAVDQ